MSRASRTRIAFVLLVFGAACAPPPPPAPPIPPPRAAMPSPADRLARGKYLVRITGCDDCHTPGAMYGSPDAARFLSGSELGWQGPWGVSYPRNLTPDAETGLGSWSEADIAKALRTGQRPDGSVLLPPMPVSDLVHLTEDDAAAIAAYLKTIPAVKHQVQARSGPGQPPTGAFVPMPPPPPPWDAPQAPATPGG